MASRYPVDLGGGTATDPYGLSGGSGKAVRRNTYTAPDAGTPNPTTTPYIPPTANPVPPESLSAPPNASSYLPDVLGAPQTDFGGGNRAQQERQINDTFGMAAPAGYDATKWADPSHESDKYLSGHILAASGGIGDVVAALNARTPGWKQVSKDTIEAPDGSQFDLYYDYGGPNQHIQFTQVRWPGGATDDGIDHGNGASAGAGLGAGTGAGFGSGAGSSNDGFYDAVLRDFLSHGGDSPHGEELWGMLTDMIKSGGLDQPALANRLVNAREDTAGQFQGLMADARDQLASRGLVSTPGVPQGPETSAIARLTSDVANQQRGTVADIENNAFNRANENVISALQMATGLSQDEAHNILQAVGHGTDREALFADVALKQLSLNEDWNKFIASYGLDRDKLEADIQSGRTDQLIELIKIFLGGAQTSAGGHY